MRTLVRGIEIGGGNPDAGIPILLGPELAKGDVPVGTMLTLEFTPTETITIRAQSEGPIGIGVLFPTTDDGQIRFGRSARSRRRDETLTDLQTGDVEFVDYVMEGFVPYHINAAIERQDDHIDNFPSRVQS